MRINLGHIRAMGAALATLAASTAFAQSPDESFYKGKTINLVIGGTVGDGYDIYARLLGSYLTKHVPGNPRVIPQNLPGAGTLVAANYMYEVAPKDGTALGTVGGGTATGQLFKTPNFRIDPRRYNWIGSLNSEVGLVLAWHDQPFKKYQDILEREFVVGGGGPTSGTVIFPLVLNRVVGAKFKIIPGYKGTSDIALAMERGEVMGTGSYHYSSMIQSKPNWISEKQVVPLVQLSLIKHPLFPDVPNIPELAKTPEQAEILQLVFARQAMGRPFLLPPGASPEATRILRTAFNAILKDPEFLQETQKRKIDLTLPMTGEEIHALLDKLYATSPDVIEKAIAASDTGDLGKR
ncbi:MAG: tripartite tricarboxylate transporter substrate-binding protein [Beijerinckiaceae bacterium]|nr:tripartite tricarboxylate transporter substrate-binding protein [Beijerinckiaceae bacterium]